MIKQIKIRDFKSIRELDLVLDDVTVLVGRSGTGKSNVVQAIRFLRNLLLNTEQAIAYEGGWGRIVPQGEKSPQTTIEVIFSLPGEERDFNYRIAFAQHPNQRDHQMIVGEHLFLSNEPLFARVIRSNYQWEWEKPPAIAVVPSPSNNGPMLGSFPSLQRVVFAYAALSTGIGFYHFPSTTLDASRNNTAPNDIWKTIPGLWDNAGNYRDVMRSIIQDFQKPNVRKNLLATLKAVNPSIASVELDSLTNPQRAIVGHDIGGSILELSLEQESDGLRRFYAHLLALYQSPSKLTLVFEEPENAIFPGALALLADEFKAAPRENRGQVILTTHSPGLLDAFDVENVRVVDMQNGKTIVGKVSQEQRNAIKDHLLTTGELLTAVDPELDQPQNAEQKA